MRMAMGDKGIWMGFAVYYGTRHYVSLTVVINGTTKLL